MKFNLPSNGWMGIDQIGLQRGITLGTKKKLHNAFAVGNLTEVLSIISELVTVYQDEVIGNESKSFSDISFPDLELVLFYLLAFSGYTEFPYTTECDCGKKITRMCALGKDGADILVDTIEKEPVTFETIDGHILYAHIPTAYDVFKIMESMVSDSLNKNEVLDKKDMIKALYELIYLCILDKNGQIPHRDIVDSVNVQDSKKLMEWTQRVTVGGSPELRFSCKCGGCGAEKHDNFPLSFQRFITEI